MGSEQATWTEITDVSTLIDLVGVPLPRVRDKARPALHELDREWLAASPFCLVATSDAEGSCDVSPKGDPAGQLAYVLDDTTLRSPSGRATAEPTATRTSSRIPTWDCSS